MAKFRHPPMNTEMIGFVMATMEDSDNKQHLLELTHCIATLLLCIHNSPLSPDMAAANCARGLLSRKRDMTAKTRHCLMTIINSAKGSSKVVLSLLKAITKIESDYTVKINSGVFCAA